MKTEDEAEQLTNLGRVVEDALTDAFIRVGKPQAVSVEYRNEIENFHVTIGDRELTVNVRFDSVLTALKELIRDIYAAELLRDVNITGGK